MVARNLKLVLVSALLVGAVAAFAQETPDQAAEEAVVETPTDAVRELSDRVGKLLDALIDDSAELPQAEGDERELLVDRILRDRDAVLDLLPQLVDQLTQLRSDGVDVAAIEDRVKGQFDKILSVLRKRFPQRKQRISELRTDVASATAEERMALDAELGRHNKAWDDALADYLLVAELKEKLGGDATKDYRALDVELRERAELRAGQLRIVARRIENATDDASTLEGDAATVAQEKVAEMKRESARIAASLTSVLGLAEKRGLDTVEYRQLLVETTGDFSSGVLNVGVLAGLAGDLVESGADWLRDNGPSTLVRIALFLAILFVFRLLAGVVRRVVEHAISRSPAKFTTLLRDFLVSTAYRLVLVFGLLIALSQLGIEVGPLLAGLGVAGFIVGFALQDTLSNFASGMMILAYRPFDVGDVVEAGGVSGIVDQLTLVSTTIRTFDNQRLIVPNNKIWGDVIINVTAERTRRVDLVFGIGYGDDIEKAQQVLTDLVKGHELVLKEPAPNIKLHKLNDSSVDFIVRPWTNTKDYWTVYWDLTREVKRRFDAEGISIPFPQRDVHLFKEE